MTGGWNSDGVHPGLFRPPVSPSPSADYLTGPTFSRETNSKRRWNSGSVLPMHDFSSGDGLFDREGAGGFFGQSSAALEPRPYALAGQLNAPSAGHGMDGSGLLGESMFSDSDYRRALGTKRSRDEMEASDSLPTQLFSLPPKPTPSAGWGSIAFSTIGGVVGRVWEFCRNGAFRGFTAGGGATFSITPPTEPSLPTPPAEEKYYLQGSYAQSEYDFYSAQRHQQHQQHQHQQAAGRTGRFYDEIPETPGDYGCSSPAPKRRHTEYLHELGRNWVMIREPNEASERRTPRKVSSSHRTSSQTFSQASPATGAFRFSTPNARASAPVLTSTPHRSVSRTTNSRPASRLSDGGSIRLGRPASAASLASFSGRPSPTPSKIPVRASGMTATPTTAGTATVTAAAAAASALAVVSPTRGCSRRRRNTAASAPSQTPQRGHRRTNSAASASMASNRVSDIDESSRLDDEAKQLATRRKMEEREADVRMTAFNKRLQDMIRQGKEALGTTIEVDVTDEEGDFAWDDIN